MKEWTFTFHNGDDWGWNSVWARGQKSAINKATKWVTKNFPDHKLDGGSVSCDPQVEKDLLSMFW